jgi:hypothetical protein
MLAPSTSGATVGKEAVEFALVGAIVPEDVETTVVANGCTDDSPAVGRTVFTEPAVAGRLVGLSVGVIVDEDSVSAKTPPALLVAAADDVDVVRLETVTERDTDGVCATALEAGVETELAGF